MKRGVKTTLLCLTMVLGSLLQAFASDCRIYLNPEARCGIFTNRRGQWSLSEYPKITLAYDKEAITLSAHLTVPEGKKFSCKGKKDDDLGLFEGSVFEFQLAPAAQKGVYYHFAVSPSKWMYSAKKKDLSWNGKSVEYRSTCVPEKEWRFTLRVPFSALGEKTPRKGDVWRVHLGKSIPTAFDNVEHSSVSGALDYHKVEQYAHLIFGENAPPERSVVFSHVKPAGDNHFTFFLTGSADISSANPKLYLESEDRSHNAFPLKKDKDTSLWKVTFPLLPKGGYIPLKKDLALPARVVTSSGKTLYQGRIVVSVKDLPKVNLDRFYYSSADSVIRYTHTLPGKTSLVIKKGQEVIYTLKNAPAKGVVSLQGKGWKQGTYTLDVTDGFVRVQQVFVLLEKSPSLPDLPANQPLKIRKDLTFSLGGEALYLLGLSRARVAIPYKSVFNFAYNPASARKNAVLMPGMPSGKLVRKPFTGRMYGDESAFLKRLADHTARMSYGNKAVFHLLSYEAQIPVVVRNSEGKIVPGSPADLMKRAYRAAKNIAPDTLFSIHVDRINQIPYYTGSCDIFQSAYWSSSYGEDIVTKMEADLDHFRTTVPDKPLIFWLGGTIPHHRFRIPEEIRCGVYLSIVKGMAGNIIHMGHDPMPLNRTRMWSLLGGLPVEIEGFYKDFASGTDVEFSLETKGIVTRMKRLPNGERILILVNTTASVAEVILPGSIAEKEVKIYNGGCSLRVTKEKSDSFWSFLLPEKTYYKDVLSAYEPRVYYLKD